MEKNKRLKLFFKNQTCLFKFRYQFIGHTEEKAESFGLDG
jgi:hypothetical protein